MKIRRVVTSLLFLVFGAILQAQDLAVELDEYWLRVSQAVEDRRFGSLSGDLSPGRGIGERQKRKIRTAQSGFGQVGKRICRYESRKNESPGRISLLGANLRKRFRSRNGNFSIFEPKGRRRMETGLRSFRSPSGQEEREMEDFDGISKVPCNRRRMVFLGP